MMSRHADDAVYAACLLFTPLLFTLRFYAIVIRFVDTVSMPHCYFILMFTLVTFTIEDAGLFVRFAPLVATPICHVTFTAFTHAALLFAAFDCLR